MAATNDPTLPEAAAELARKGDTAGLSTMIKDGLAVDAQDAKGNTLLMLAAYHGKAETVAMLLSALCDPADGLAGECVQVLCITHSPELQRRCGRVVKLGRGADGATVVMGGGGASGAEGRKGRSSPARLAGQR